MPMPPTPEHMADRIALMQKRAEVEGLAEALSYAIDALVQARLALVYYAPKTMFMVDNVPVNHADHLHREIEDLRKRLADPERVRPREEGW